MGFFERFLIPAGFFLLFASAHAAVISDFRAPADPGLESRIGDLFSGIGDVSPELRDAIAAYNAGNVIAAKERVTRVLQRNPEDPAALHVAGTIFMHEGRYRNAQVAFEAALKSGVRNPQILAKLGATRLLMGDSAKGWRILRLAQRIDPANPLALRYLAWLAERDRRYGEAAVLYGKLAAHGGAGGLNPHAVARARALNKAGRLDEAIEVLSVVAGDANDSTTHVAKAAVAQLIDAYIKSGRVQLAASRLASATENNQIDPVQAAVFATELAIRRRDWASAEQAIATALASHPDVEHVVRSSASRAYVAERELGRAIDQMKDAVAYLRRRQDPDMLFSAVNELAALYVQADRKIDALRLMNKTVKAFPGRPKPAYQLAEIQTSLGQLAAANETLDGILAGHPDFYLAHYLKGIVSRRQNDHVAADQWFRKANGLRPSFEKAWVQRAANLIDAGKRDAALDVLARSVELNGSNPTLWFEYGALLTAAGEHRRAISAYKSVLEMVPDYLPAIDNLAGELLLLGERPAEAMHYALRAVRMDPNDRVLQLNYLEALFQNGKYEHVIENGKKVESAFGDSARFHFLMGASHLKTGDPATGNSYLQRARADGSLEPRYLSKLDELSE